ncbi:MAG: DMT family transporter, partial [Acidimicrobiia bacterium]|nr:DMT family transporter [Acidimicrobiia bacterium]
MTKPSPLLAALGGAVLISFSAIFFRASEADPITGGFFRMGLALPILFVLAWRLRSQDRRSRSDRVLAVTAGVLLGLDGIAWHAAIGHVGTGLATLTANSQVMVVPLVTWMALGERPSNRALWAMPVVMVGLALLTGLGRSDSFGTRPVLGISLAVLAAAFYSGFLILFRRSGRSLPPPAAGLLDVTLGGALTIGAIGVVTGDLDPTPAPATLAWLAALAICAQVAGWLAISYALPRLSAAATSFAILLQPSLT